MNQIEYKQKTLKITYSERMNQIEYKQYLVDDN
jgi:hypothetical protein